MGQGASAAEDGGYVLIYSDSHQDPGSTVLNVLQLLGVLIPDEESVAVVQFHLQCAQYYLNNTSSQPRSIFTMMENPSSL